MTEDELYVHDIVGEPKVNGPFKGIVYGIGISLVIYAIFALGLWLILAHN